MNAFGYADDDLTGEEYTRRGMYLRLRARFDESLFLGRTPAALPPPSGATSDATGEPTSDASDSAPAEDPR